MDKIPGSGSGRVGVSKYTIGYFRVCRVFPGMSGIYGYLRVYTGILDIISFLVVVSKILRFDGSSGDLKDIHAHI